MAKLLEYLLSASYGYNFFFFWEMDIINYLKHNILINFISTIIYFQLLTDHVNFFNLKH